MIGGIQRPLALIALLTLSCAPPAQAGNPPLATVRVASGLADPLFVTYAPGDFDRIFIVEQGGRIRVLHLPTGVLRVTPFLDITGRVRSGGERGLLGLAFHPDYANNGWFFVNYTDLAGDTVVARFQVTADPDIAGAASEQIILQIPQPFPNHNGGWLGFGPGDGFLYIATGDGGGSGGPLNNGQNTARLLGKMLRIDVDTASPFAIPPDNPFVGVAGALDEIWAFGLRNPWRCAFDSETGELFIADVGQDVVEEIDVQPAASPGGENYGWRCREGGNCFDPACCNNAGFTDPVHTYTHGGLPFRCSITGGEVYRGCAIEGLAGTYFFADLCSNQIWSFRFNGSVVGFQERTAELAPGGGLNISGVSSFGRDALGELYIVDLFDGEVFKIIPDPSTFVPDCNRNNRADACDLITGEGTDADGNGVLDQCEVVVPVPTLGTWGVMLLALLVVAAGTVLITRRVET